jgi:hypothetical protein
MVDLVLLQSVSYVAAAIGVCIAAIYYAFMVRINQRTMRITLTNNLIQRLLTDEFVTKFTELMYMDWEDYDDFERKYGSDNNPENYNKRTTIWGTLDSLGILLLKGLADKDVLYNSQMAFSSVFLWSKFQSVLEENRRRYTGKDGWIGLEHLAKEMLRTKRIRDPAYKVPEAYLRYTQTG